MLKFVFVPVRSILTLNPAGIELSQSITIPGVGGSNFSISISVDSNKTETKEASRQLSNTWDITYLFSILSRSTIDTLQLQGRRS